MDSCSSERWPDRARIDKLPLLHADSPQGYLVVQTIQACPASELRMGPLVLQGSSAAWFIPFDVQQLSSEPPGFIGEAYVLGKGE